MRLFGVIYFALATSCALIQLIIGGEPVLTLTYYIISLSGLVIAFPKGQTMVSYIYFGFSVYTGLASLLFKTLLLQPVQDNIQDANQSAFVMLLGYACITIGYIVSRIFPIGYQPFENISRDFSSARFLNFISKFGFVVGYILMILHTIFKPKLVNGVDSGAGFGGFGSFYFVLIFGFAAQCALAITSNSRARERTITIAMFVLMLFLSLAANQKKYLLDAGLTLLLVALAYNVKLRPQQVIAGIAFLMITQFVISPVIHLTRNESSQKTIAERIDLTSKILSANHYDLGKINQLNDNVSKGFAGSYRASGSYFYPSTLNIDRFALVLPIDQVVRVEDPGRVGWDLLIKKSLEIVLPSTLISKTQESLTDQVSWRYGFRQTGVISRPVVGLTASSYGINGLLGVVLINTTASLVLFWVLGALGGPLRHSAWTAALLVTCSLAPEMDPTGIIGLIIRQLPIIVVTMMILMALTMSAARNAAGARVSSYPVRGAP